MAPDPVSDLWNAVRRAIRAYFAERRRERRREQVDDWKEAGVYPYEGELASEPEQAERAVFDVVSSALAPHVSKKNRAGARLTLTLLRDAIRNDPENLAVILQEVVALSNEDHDTLIQLLGETTLSAIIKSANLIASRRKFLALAWSIFSSTRTTRQRPENGITCTGSWNANCGSLARRTT